MGSLQLHYHGLSYSISVYRKLSDILSAMQVPPTGKGSLYIRPLLFGSGSVLGVSPAPEYTFLVFVSPVGNYFKVGQSVVSNLTARYRRYVLVRKQIVVFNRRRTLLGSIILITVRKREKKQGRRKRKREKKRETSVVGEPRDDAMDVNVTRRRLLRRGLLLVTFSFEVTRKRGDLNEVAEASPHPRREEKTRVILSEVVLHNLLMSRRCGSLIFAGFKLLQGRVWERRSWGCISTALFFTYETTDGPFRGQDGVDNAVRLGATQ
ncbi:hypothetical protein GW17_00026312 [Ensete ventricosum]|nr:hypothetical protein GW17_00026312 [Ensete ventricosum]